MLIKLTSQCTMNCPHCMEDAKDSGEMMTLETFKRTVYFGLDLGARVFVLSGGEPTENEHIFEMCQWFNKTFRAKGRLFSIVSNGMWLKYEEKKSHMRCICQMPTFAGMQVYTNKRWYKEYDYVVEHKEEYQTYRCVTVDIDSPIYMQDLGRARTDKDAQEEVKKNPYNMSCLNPALAVAQAVLPLQVCESLEERRQLCKPSVDCEGNVHLSESRLCPSVGNVMKDTTDIIFFKMRDFRPCGACRQYRNFIESTRPDIVVARRIIYKVR